MPRRIRGPSAAGAALVVALAGVLPSLTAAPAWSTAVAGQPEAGTQVRFGGAPLGLGALWCRAEPDQTRLRVLAESKVTFVNYTGRRAAVQVDGREVGTLEPNHGLPLVFRDGPVTVSMVPDCGFTVNRAIKAVQVDVVPSATDTENSSLIFSIGNPSAAARGTVAVAAVVAVTPAPTSANPLVALVATVCVAGASAGAIRAIIAQRASSTPLA